MSETIDLPDNALPGSDLTDCDREPIHVPGAIQPHGMMLVVERDTLTVTHAAGDVEARLAEPWRGAALGEVIGDDLAARTGRLTDSGGGAGYVGRLTGRDGHPLDVSVQLSGRWLIVELEPAPEDAAPASLVLGALASAGGAFERATSLVSLCQRAAVEFRRMTGFDRVMIYRFLDDAAGAVLAEDKVDELPSFLNHHFPGGDIPRQARALYVRNLVRVIPDIGYAPAPLRPAWTEPEPLDMSDAVLRSVSPVHMQYMRNMGVGASASVSIVKDGVLWGLIACHHRTPRLLHYDVRAACAALAGGLARQIRAKEDAELYRERIRLRGIEDALIEGLGGEASPEAGLTRQDGALRKLMSADGAAVVSGDTLYLEGVTPPAEEVRRLAAAMARRGEAAPFASDALGEVDPAALPYADIASGLLAVSLAAAEPFVILWFRAEKPQVIEWAGNPHKEAALGTGGMLTPRTSFEAWRETVRGRSEAWTLPQVEAAARLKAGVLELRQRRRMIDLNRALGDSVAAKDALIEQKDLLLREVNHRVQNSLQLVSSFLELQSRDLEPAAKASFSEAQRRLSAVALVHRRLYRSDQVQTVDLARYIEDLLGDMLESMDDGWRGQVSLDLAPVIVTTDRAVTIGLVLTELVINANKYAYDRRPGPVEISLEQTRNTLRLIVADRGKGKHTPGSGFGTRMMNVMVRQLTGELTYDDNKPGLRAILSAPLEAA